MYLLHNRMTSTLTSLSRTSPRTSRSWKSIFLHSSRILRTKKAILTQASPISPSTSWTKKIGPQEKCQSSPLSTSLWPHKRIKKKKAQSILNCFTSVSKRKLERISSRATGKTTCGPDKWHVMTEFLQHLDIKLSSKTLLYLQTKDLSCYNATDLKRLLVK